MRIPKTHAERRERRHNRVRAKVAGTPERPRLVVYRSLKHIYAQIVDDVAQKHAADGNGSGIERIKDVEVDRGREAGRGASKGGGDHACRVRPRRLPIPRSREGSGRRRPRRRAGVLMADEQENASTESTPGHSARVAAVHAVAAVRGAAVAARGAAAGVHGAAAAVVVAAVDAAALVAVAVVAADLADAAAVRRPRWRRAAAAPGGGRGGGPGGGRDGARRDGGRGGDGQRSEARIRPHRERDRHQPRRQGREGRPAILVQCPRRRRRRQGQGRLRDGQGERSLRSRAQGGRRGASRA